ncbi:LOB domain-containing protein 1-like [Rhodamnia argentea]|uniref:LOB domain-containing protein 1-like n=1 Tax=Rhodamnia argentea TaxID=178133 RepID=A0A8B8QJB3_9MYRT|nr:LOB domain-containing protein 1-like [Rhodamnia argentea]
MEKSDEFSKSPLLPAPIAVPSSPFLPHSPTYLHPPSSPLPPQFCPATPPPPPSPHNNGPPPSPPAMVLSPCAACKILRRRCADKCVLAPYFPPTEPYKFTIAHRVFGAANIIKFLQELPEPRRADAVSSMVYEASARIRDPVYGCTGAISQLQKQVVELQAQLAKAQAEIANVQCQNANLLALICMEMAQIQDQPVFQPQCPTVDASCFLDETSLISTWEPLWT